MSDERRVGPWLVVSSFAVAFLLDVIALPAWLELLWPSWVTLVLIYWCMRLPQRIGVGCGWVMGLLLDAAGNALLGQHALALAVVAYLTLKIYRRLRLFPVWQQALTVVLLALVDKLLVFWISGMIGYPPADAWFLLPASSTLLAWPLLLIFLSDLGKHQDIERI